MSDLAVWNSDEDDRLVCRQVRVETHDVKTFVFSGRTPCVFRFRPGQFLTFDFPIDDRRVNRCYTISSAPTRPDTLSITVKRVPGGLVSNWLHDAVRPGLEVHATGPAGEFSPQSHPAAPKYLFLSGGSGITPLMSMARSHYDLADDVDVVFVHNARSPADIIFRAELELIARGLPGFRLAVVCEADSEGERWGGHRGRLTLAMLRSIAPDLLERTIFTCGPKPYMAAVRAMLAQETFEPARYHQESFSFEDIARGPAMPPQGPERAAGPTFSVALTKSGQTVPCDAGTYVLDAARAAGLRLPSSCTRGVCGTCKSKLLSGKVDMLHAGGIRQREIDAGQILLCCSKPLCDLVIER